MRLTLNPVWGDTARLTITFYCHVMIFLLKQGLVTPAKRSKRFYCHVMSSVTIGLKCKKKAALMKNLKGCWLSLLRGPKSRCRTLFSVNRKVEYARPKISGEGTWNPHTLRNKALVTNVGKKAGLLLSAIMMCVCEF